MFGRATLLLLLLLATGAADARGAANSTSAPTTAPATPRDLAWQKLAPDVEIGEMAVAGEAKPLAVAKVALDAQGGTVRVLEIDKPNVTAASWEIAGRVKYADVQGDAFLEMWSHFPDGSAYFTRTLDKSGPMGVLHGKSEWREFRLPFLSEPGKTPSKLVVNVVMPGGGTVWLGPAKLTEGRGPATGRTGAGGPLSLAWWGRTGDGRVVGLMLGLYGAVMGILASWARGRRLSVPVMVGGLCVCGVVLIAGLIAWGGGQPHRVWYPLLLIGTIGGTVTGCLLPVLKRRLEEEELRRMTALDV